MTELGIFWGGLRKNSIFFSPEKRQILFLMLNIRMHLCRHMDAHMHTQRLAWAILNAQANITLIYNQENDPGAQFKEISGNYISKMQRREIPYPISSRCFYLQVLNFPYPMSNCDSAQYCTGNRLSQTESINHLPVYFWLKQQLYLILRLTNE